MRTALNRRRKGLGGGFDASFSQPANISAIDWLKKPSLDDFLMIPADLLPC